MKCYCDTTQEWLRPCSFCINLRGLFDRVERLEALIRGERDLA